MDIPGDILHPELRAQEASKLETFLAQLATLLATRGPEREAHHDGEEGPRGRPL